MLVEFPPANLAESLAVWRAKASPAAVLLGRGEADVRFFFWSREKQFTVLEDFTLKVIERGLGHSDAEIARVLCLNEADIAAICSDINCKLEGRGLKDRVQGDSSRRTLPKGFRKERDGIALADAAEGKKQSHLGDIGVGEVDRANIIRLARDFGRPDSWSGMPKERKGWMQKEGAKIFALPFSAFRYNDQSWVFCCGGNVFPTCLNGPLLKLKVFHGIGGQTAPSGVVCHRDEFWPWLKHRIGKKTPERIAFESVRRDDDASKWLREEMGIIAEFRDVQNKGPESVCLDDERFALRGDFVCRA